MSGVSRWQAARSRRLVVALTVTAAFLPAGSAVAQTSPSGAQAIRSSDLTLSKGAPAALKRDRNLLKSRLLAGLRLAKSRPCRAVAELQEARQMLVTRTPGRRTALGGEIDPELETDVLDMQSRLLTSPATRRCGGGADSPAAGGPEVEVRAADARHIAVRVKLPRAEFSHVRGGSGSFPQIAMNGLVAAGPTGAPALPSLSKFIAVPRGATASVRVGSMSSYRLTDISVLPRQRPAANAVAPPASPSPLHPLFRPRPFTIDNRAYGRRSQFPRAIAALGSVGRSPDVAVAPLTLNAATTAPRARTMRVFTSVDLVVTFSGGDGTFADSDLLSSWNRPLRTTLQHSVLNFEAMLGALSTVAPKPLCGEEMMIISSPGLRAAADRLAAARNLDGVITKVFETGAADVGTTAAQIKSLVESHVFAKSCAIRPSYVLLMGDHEHVPTFKPTGLLPALERAQGVKEDKLAYKDIATDYPYTPSVLGIPLGGVGRIPAQDLAEANAAVDKIIAYEQAPPAEGDFYKRASLLSYFESPTVNDKPDFKATQDARAFIHDSEQARSRLVAAGKTVDRIYATGDPSVKPKTDKYGGALPKELQKPNFAWDGDGADIGAAWNAGRFLMFHLDHGGTRAWSAPAFGTGGVAALTNGTRTPVVLSLNCLTGQFDDRSFDSFDALHLLRAGAGSVGGIAPSRITWGEVGSYAQGALDALYPPKPNTAPMLELGLVANSARIASLMAFGILDPYTLDNIQIFNLFGDPSMQVWAHGAPKRFDMAKFTAQRSFTGRTVDVSADGLYRGATVTIVGSDGGAYGRGQLDAAGRASIELLGRATGIALTAVVSDTGFVSNRETVQ